MKKSYKDDNFGSRIANAAKARKAVLARIKAQPGPGDPDFEKRKAERHAAAEAISMAMVPRTCMLGLPVPRLRLHPNPLSRHTDGTCGLGSQR